MCGREIKIRARQNAAGRTVGLGRRTDFSTSCAAWWRGKRKNAKILVSRNALEWRLLGLVGCVLAVQSCATGSDQETMELHCQDGARWCDGNIAHRCEGSSVFSLACSADTPLCIDGYCRSCSPGAIRCNDASNSVERCSSEGGSWELVETCPEPTICVDGFCSSCPPPIAYCPSSNSSAVCGSSLGPKTCPAVSNKSSKGICLGGSCAVCDPYCEWWAAAWQWDDPLFEFATKHVSNRLIGSAVTPLVGPSTWPETNTPLVGQVEQDHFLQHEWKLDDVSLVLSLKTSIGVPPYIESEREWRGSSGGLLYGSWSRLEMRSASTLESRTMFVVPALDLERDPLVPIQLNIATAPAEIGSMPNSQKCKIETRLLDNPTATMEQWVTIGGAGSSSYSKLFKLDAGSLAGALVTVDCTGRQVVAARAHDGHFGRKEACIGLDSGGTHGACVGWGTTCSKADDCPPYHFYELDISSATENLCGTDFVVPQPPSGERPWNTLQVVPCAAASSEPDRGDRKITVRSVEGYRAFDTALAPPGMIPFEGTVSVHSSFPALVTGLHGWASFQTSASPCNDNTEGECPEYSWCIDSSCYRQGRGWSMYSVPPRHSWSSSYVIDHPHGTQAATSLSVVGHCGSSFATRVVGDGASLHVLAGEEIEGYCRTTVPVFSAGLVTVSCQRKCSVFVTYRHPNGVHISQATAI